MGSLNRGTSTGGNTGDSTLQQMGHMVSVQIRDVLLRLLLLYLV